MRKKAVVASVYRKKVNCNYVCRLRVCSTISVFCLLPFCCLLYTRSAGWHEVFVLRYRTLLVHTHTREDFTTIVKQNVEEEKDTELSKHRLEPFQYCDLVDFFQFVLIEAAVDTRNRKRITFNDDRLSSAL